MRYTLPLFTVVSVLAFGCANEGATGHAEALASTETPTEAVTDTVGAPEEATPATAEAAEPTTPIAEAIPTHDTPPPAPCTQAWFEYEQAQMAAGGQARLTQAAFLTRCGTLPESTRPCLLAGYAHGNEASCREQLRALPSDLRASARDLGAMQELDPPSS